MSEHGTGTPAPDRSVGAHLRAVRTRHDQTDRDAKAEHERQRLDEYEVVGELVAPRLRARASLTERGRHADTGDHEARGDEKPGHDPHQLSGARLRLALSRTALEGLERAQLVPRLLVRLGCGQAEPPGIGLDDPLADADVDRAALDACGTALAPEAQIAFRERIRDRVVGDARLLRRRVAVVGRHGEIAGREDARLVAAAARHAGVLADEARAGARLDLKGVHRADVEALRRRTLQARLLMELPAVGVRGLDHRVDLRLGVVEDPDARHI